MNGLARLIQAEVRSSCAPQHSRELFPLQRVAGKTRRQRRGGLQVICCAATPGGGDDNSFTPSSGNLTVNKKTLGRS
eukprot:scaffold14801_cov105-Isochrysis_galbana.AAC.4